MIEIRGLRETLNGARAAIRGVREHTAGLHDDLARLTQTVTGLRQQVNEAHDDLRFEAETLGNSQGSEERLKPSETAGNSEGLLHLKDASPVVVSRGQGGTEPQVGGTVTDATQAALGTGADATAPEKPKPLAGFETATSLANSGRTT